MSRFRILGFSGALVAAALIGGTIMSAVAAAPPRSATPDAAAAGTTELATLADPGSYCLTFRRAFAANLGVDEADLGPAAKKAAITTIDAAVAAGDISKAVGDRLKAKVEAAEGDGCRWFAAHLKRIAGAVHVIRDGVTAAAEVLDMTPAELRSELRSGKTLKEIATAEGVNYDTLTAAVIAAVKSDLDAAVKAGTITQARADRILDRLERNLADGRFRPAKAGRAAGG
jgi:ribosomal protein S20